MVRRDQPVGGNYARYNADRDRDKDKGKSNGSSDKPGKKTLPPTRWDKGRDPSTRFYDTKGNKYERSGRREIKDDDPYFKVRVKGMVLILRF